MNTLIKPLRWWEKVLDLLFLPIMYVIAWVSGRSFKESPQRTHRWNNVKLPPKIVDILLTTFVKGVPNQLKKQGGVRFHIPFLGGWRNYVVVSPENPEKGWYPGWHNKHITGASRIICYKPVRLLVGSESIYFMGFDCQGNQIKVKVIGKGKIGVVGPYTSTTLL